MLLDRESEQPDNDLSYVFGWLCAGLPIVGVGVMIFNLAKGNRRKALQAAVLSVVLLGYLGSLLFFGRNWTRELDWLAQTLWWGGIVGVPLLTLWLLRRVPDHQPRASSS